MMMSEEGEGATGCMMMIPADEQPKWRLSTPRKRSNAANAANAKAEPPVAVVSILHHSNADTPSYLSPTSSEEGIGIGGGGAVAAAVASYEQHYQCQQRLSFRRTDEVEEEKENVDSPLRLARSKPTTLVRKNSNPRFTNHNITATTTATTATSATTTNANTAITTTNAKSPLIWKEEGAALRLKQKEQQQLKQRAFMAAAAASSSSSVATSTNYTNQDQTAIRRSMAEKRVSFSPEQPSRYSFCSMFQQQLHQHHQPHHSIAAAAVAPPPTPPHDEHHHANTNATLPSSQLPPVSPPPPPPPPTAQRLLYSMEELVGEDYYSEHDHQPHQKEVEEENNDKVDDDQQEDEGQWAGTTNRHSTTSTTTTTTTSPQGAAWKTILLQDKELPSTSTITTSSSRSPKPPPREPPTSTDSHPHVVLFDTCRHAKHASDIMAVLENHSGGMTTTTTMVAHHDWIESTNPNGQTIFHALSENHHLAHAMWQERKSLARSQRHPPRQHQQLRRKDHRCSKSVGTTTTTMSADHPKDTLVMILLWLLQATRRSATVLLTTRDDQDGYLPFEKILRQWIIEQHEDHAQRQRQQQRPARTSSLSRLFSTTSWAKAATSSWTHTAGGGNKLRRASIHTTTTTNHNHHVQDTASAGDNAHVDDMASRRFSGTSTNTTTRASPSKRPFMLQPPPLQAAALPRPRDSWSVSSSSRGDNSHYVASLGGTVDLDQVERGDMNHKERDDDDDPDLEDPPSHNQQNTIGNAAGAAAVDLFGSYPHVQVTASAYYALTLLSAIVDALTQREEDDDSENENDDEDHHDTGGWYPRRNLHQIPEACQIRETVVQTMAMIPGFLQTILLIQNKNDRQWALSCPLVQAVIRHKHSVGPWLTAMLRQSDQDPRVSEAAVDYLQLISSLHPASCDARGHSTTSTTQGHASHLHHQRMSWSSATSSKSGDDDNNHKDGPQKDKQQMQDLYDEISRLDDFIPSLLGLGERGVEEAATTRVVRRVLDQMISRPFSVSVVLGDAIFLGLLAASFRQAANNFVLGRDSGTVLKWIYVANAGIFYFIIRELGKAVSLWMITRTSKTYFGSFWNVSDMLCTILALSSTIALRFHYNYYANADLDDTQLLRQLLAVTTAFLWLRVLNLLKAINLQLATFVLAILQITRDILWFCVILLTMVVSFAQAFYTLLVPASCATSQMKGNQLQQECTQSEYYLSLYSVLLGGFGDLQRSSFTTSFSVFLIVGFTFMVQIILLNVLIAVASDSYEKCLMRAQNLFGRARVMLIAELVSFQNLLRKNPNSPGRASHPFSHTSIFRSKDLYDDFWNNNGWSPGSVVFFKASAVVVVVWTLAEIIGYMSRERQHGNIMLSLGSILVNVLLFVCMIAFLQNRVDGLPNQPSYTEANREQHRSSWPWGTSSRMIGVLTSWYDRVAQKAVLRMFGSMQQTSSRMSGKHGETEEWNGRILYMQGQMRRMIQESQLETLEHLRASERRMIESQELLRQDMMEILLQQHQDRPRSNGETSSN